MARELDAETAEPEHVEPAAKSTVAGDDLSHALDRETIDIPEAAKHVIRVEKAAEEEHGERTAAVAWLYRGREEPREVALGRLPEILSDGASFVWVNLS